MIKRLMWTVLVVVVGLLLADLVALNVYVARMRRQLSAPSPSKMPYTDFLDPIGSFYAVPVDSPQYWE